MEVSPEAVSALVSTSREVDTFLRLISEQCKGCVVPEGSGRCNLCWTPRAKTLHSKLATALEALSPETRNANYVAMILERIRKASPNSVRAACIRIPGCPKKLKGELLASLVARKQIHVERRTVGGRSAYFYAQRWTHSFLNKKTNPNPKTKP